MLTHNLKIAIRNLLKYKLQTTISVLSIAIGIVVLSAVHSYAQRHLQAPKITQTDYYDRACRIYIDSLHATTTNFFTAVQIKSEIVRAIKNGGELYSVELGPIFPNSNTQLISCNARFALGDTIERNHMLYDVQVEPLYPYYAAYESFYTHKRIQPLRANEVIISRTMAKKVFGDTNPIGGTIETDRYYIRGIKMTIVDVYSDIVQHDVNYRIGLLFAVDEATHMKTLDSGYWYAKWMNVVLKKGCTADGLLQELNMRLTPLGLKARVETEKEHYADVLSELRTTKILTYLLGSLILLAAIIGFLRMQMQLFYMRKREMSLRIVNGAKRPELFALLMTEVTLVIISAVVVSLMCGSVERLINNFSGHIKLNGFIYEDGIILVDNLMQYSAIIGGALLVLCGIVVWFTLTKICRNEQGLAANMRGARNHTFRNSMLYLQVTVGMLFVSITFAITLISHRVSQRYTLPEDDRPYRESIIVSGGYAKNPIGLYEELNALPDVAQIIPYECNNLKYKEISDNDSLVKAKFSNGWCYFKTHIMNDTTPLDFYDVQINWKKPELKGKPCILIHEEMYATLESYGVLSNGILTYSGRFSLPVAGTFREFMFNDNKEENRQSFIVINPTSPIYKCIIVPRIGRYGALWNEVQNTIERVEPTLVRKLAHNLYEQQAAEIVIMENMRKAAWILGCVALLVCIMGIYSTVALDTRARRKEVAIHKINGAKPKDIALMFTRLYVILMALALAALMPLALIIRHSCSKFPEDPTYNLPVVMLTLAGCFVVAVVIALIVGWQVRGTIKINPVEMIVKE